MPRTTIKSEDIADTTVVAADLRDDSITNAKIKSDAAIAQSKLAEVTAGDLASTLDLSSKTVTLPAASVTAHVTQFDDNQLKEEIALLGFRTAANGSLAKYNLVDQTIDAFEDAAGVDAGASTNPLRNATDKYYAGGANTNATGGTITTYTDGGVDYVVHSFTSAGSTTWTPPSAGNVSILLVGGGGGGAYGGGGGGGGGLSATASQAVTAQGYSIVVGTGGGGSGGSGGTGPNTIGTPGVSTTGLGQTATGGGGGTGRANTNAGGRASPGGTSGSPQSNAGGSSSGTPGSEGGGGGGGAGAVGNSGNSAPGGAGATNDYRTGSDVTYAGGGGGAGTGGGSGGSGGGGAGRSNNTGIQGTDNLGGGGGGGGFFGSNGAGGTGGLGIAVIRYPDDTFQTGGANLTLISNATTAEAVPTKGDLVMTYTNGAGTASIGDGTNGDIRAFVSRDDGTTWTQLTLASQGSTGAHTILTAHDLDISGQPSGTDMRYKITTHNQSATKTTRVHAVSLGWS